MQKLKELIKLSNLCNFQLLQEILKEIPAIKNCEIAVWQKGYETCILCKISSF